MGTPQADTAATFTVQLHAFRADGSEFLGTYPEAVTVTLGAGCDFAFATSASALAADGYVDPADPGSTMCPNVASTGPTPPPMSATVTAAGAPLLLGWNGGYVPPNPVLIAQAVGVPSATLSFP